MVFVGTSEVILRYCQNKYISPKCMERIKVQFTILKNSEHFSNQKILNFSLAISLDLVSPIVSKYVKFNLPKNFILNPTWKIWSLLHKMFNRNKEKQNNKQTNGYNEDSVFIVE